MYSYQNPPSRYKKQITETTPQVRKENLPARTNNPDQAINPQTLYNTHDRVV